MNPKIRIAAVAAALVAAAFLFHNYYLSPEAAVKRVVRSAAAAFEQKDADGFVSTVSRDYADDQGLAFADIESSLTRAFAAFETYNITIEKLEARVSGTTANAAMLVTLVVTTKDKEKYMAMGTPESGQRISVDLRREQDGQWRVTRVTGYTRP